MLGKISLIRKNRKKVLGLNERYLEYIRPFNSSYAFNIADDKLLTKEILNKQGIPVPKMITAIRSNEELEEFDFDTLPKSFVIKPVHGVRGGGVEIFYNKDKEGNWIRNDGSRISINALKTLCRDIIDGRFSLHNETDTVLIEERVRPHKDFRYYTYKGTPDVRIIVFNNIPVMGMLRLPTEKSLGRANLDQGAIGTGIDMAVGKTTSAIYGKYGYIEKIPHTKLPVSGFQIPNWNKILRYSIEASKHTELGFCAVDFLIDRDFGPMIVELNARPGLSIQLANEAGLRARLKKASGIEVKTTEKGMRLAKDLFGGEIEKEIELMSGKDVIGIYENISIIGVNNRQYDCKAKIDTGADRTSFDINIAYQLGYGELIDEFQTLKIPYELEKDEAIELAKKYEPSLLEKYEYLNHLSIVKSSHGVSLRLSVKVSLRIDNTVFETVANIFDRSRLDYPAIVGRKSLTKFLVDPSKKA